MKKIILLLMIAFVGIINTVDAQKEINFFSMGITTNYIESEILEVDDEAAFMFSIDYNWLHLDYSNSLREYNNDKDNLNWYGGNVGVNFKLSNPSGYKPLIYITPKIGYVVSEQIYGNIVTYREGKMNGGIQLTLSQHDTSITMGTGTIQRIYFTIGINLNYKQKQ